MSEIDITMTEEAITEDVLNLKNTDITSRNSVKVSNFNKPTFKKDTNLTVEIKAPKRSDIIKKYKGKTCAMSQTLPCTVEMCSLTKCDRVQALEDAENVKKPIPNTWKGSMPKNLAVNRGKDQVSTYDTTVSRASNALDRMFKK